MKSLFNVNHNTAISDIAVLLLRILIAALMLSHGIPKFASLLSGNVQFPALFGLDATSSLSIAVFSEVFCSLLILIGFGTRLAVIPLIITMLVAVFYIHAADPFAIKELAVLYLVAYIILLLKGSGKYSIDNLLTQRLQKPAYNHKTIEDPTISIYS
ncbi:DoxX family protein [Flavihumibacter profundi]|jgi:putative oxidoreductase|uniref:DoxX family protein n=1 Tax=Flavihumibacter profundi TaxID=2716883 RepID=UPI001CC3F635|nr:DoxX family protein [Flavihumibacter profundi]MBZ5856117.1 DoxX family protein [Flavihumibacter profundi]